MGSEDLRVSQRMNYITKTVSLSCGERIEFEGQELVLNPNFLSVITSGGSYSVSLYDFTANLSALQLEKFLQKVVIASEDAKPISWSEFKRRTGIKDSLVRTLDRRQEKAGDFVRASPDDVVPF